MIPITEFPPCPITPRPGFCVILREDAQKYTKLALPGKGGAGRELMAEARVLAVGGDIYHACGTLLGPDFKAGDRVLTQGHNGFCTHKITPWDTTVFEVLPFNQIAGVLEETPEPEESTEELPEIDEPTEPPGLVPVLETP